MARQPLNIAPPNTVSETNICDIDGKVIMVIRYSDFTLDHPTTGIEQHKSNTYIQTVDGRQWNPLQLLAKPPVYIGICTDCRRPPFRWWGRETPTHGIVTLQRARVCVDCGKQCCPRHVKRNRNGVCRCRPCARKHRLKTWLKALFFTNVEVE